MMNSFPPQFCSQHQLQHNIYIFLFWGWGWGDTIKKNKEGYVNVLNIGELD